MQAPRFERFKKYFSRRKQSIEEVVREATAGGVVFRLNEQKQVEILLIQDPRERWTIPKGHIEEGETAQETAVREIKEEAGLSDTEVLCWLGKIHFRYRRLKTLVLMTTQIYLVRAKGDTDAIKKEDYMNSIQWFPFNEALDKIEYEDIGKLMLLGMKKLRHMRII
ncbi:MAG: NUDIX domain-containing protein [Candidatus Chaera renei]|uniref:NUDIX domain-containing protein n=1 Tax=Candidatus Chaera renei TaxID=2506947 RepID=A0A4Q0AK34_9BACT|nr:MAG: NUDIX domain-containing protein [Candidatus Chaera renei]